MYVLTGTIEFPKHRGSGPNTQIAKVTFPRDVSEANVVMTAFQGGFSRGDGDHEFGSLSVELAIKEVRGRAVWLVGSLGVRDWSGQWDDYYEGHAAFAVFAHLK